MISCSLMGREKREISSRLLIFPSLTRRPSLVTGTQSFSSLPRPPRPPPRPLPRPRPLPPLPLSPNPPRNPLLYLPCLYLRILHVHHHGLCRDRVLYLPCLYLRILHGNLLYHHHWLEHGPPYLLL